MLCVVGGRGVKQGETRQGKGAGGCVYEEGVVHENGRQIFFFSGGCVRGIGGGCKAMGTAKHVF